MISLLPRNGSFCSMILYANDGIRINKFFYKCILFLRTKLGNPCKNVFWFMRVIFHPFRRKVKDLSKDLALPKRRSGCVNALYITMCVISFSKCRFVPRAIKDRPAVENSRRDFTPGWVIMRVRHRRTHLLYPAANSTIVESSRIPRWAA